MQQEMGKVEIALSGDRQAMQVWKPQQRKGRNVRKAKKRESHHLSDSENKNDTDVDFEHHRIQLENPLSTRYRAKENDIKKMLVMPFAKVTPCIFNFFLQSQSIHLLRDKI